MGTKYSLTRAKAGKSLGVAAVPDENDLYEPFTRFCWYRHELPFEDQWASEALDMRVHGISIFDQAAPVRRRFCVVSAEGDVALMQSPSIKERILGAGIESPDSKFWGRMEGIAAVGDHLYACGEGGQIYRRASHGVWQNLDPRLLRPLKEGFSANEHFLKLAGLREDEIYLTCASGKIMFFDGEMTRIVHEGPRETLIDLLVENEDRVGLWPQRKSSAWQLANGLQTNAGNS